MPKTGSRRVSLAAVVINAAGRGSRLGHNLPKSLITVAGRRLLEWQLTQMCRNVADLSIVVGYMADEVARLAVSIRPDIQVLVNERWETTKTGGSLSLGAAQVTGRCVSLDGDLLVAPADFERMLAATRDLIGVCPPSSSQPVYAQLDRQLACRGFSYQIPSPWEWTGLLNFDPQNITMSDGNVYEMVESILPVQTLDVRCVEVDTPADLVLADARWPQVLEMEA
jgi:choline kinase